MMERRLVQRNNLGDFSVATVNILLATFFRVLPYIAVNHGDSSSSEPRLHFLVLIPWALMALSWIITWFTTADSSPFSSFMHSHEGAEEWWLWLNIIPFFVVVRSPIPPSTAKFLILIFAMSTQWFIVGWVVSFFCRRLVDRFSRLR
jgi:hypothetical protein